jgi:hypothetical protein
LFFFEFLTGLSLTGSAAALAYSLTTRGALVGTGSSSSGRHMKNKQSKKTGKRVTAPIIAYLAGFGTESARPNYTNIMSTSS